MDQIEDKGTANSLCHSKDDLIYDDVHKARDSMALREQAYQSPIVCKVTTSVIFGLVSMISAKLAPSQDDIPDLDYVHDEASDCDNDFEARMHDINNDSSDYALPEKSELVPSQSAPPGHTWWHVDTGAMAPCTTMANDLINCITVQGSCGTAKAGSLSSVVGIGSAIFQFGGDAVTSLSVPMDGILVVPEFFCQSCSLHALKHCGYKADHRFHDSGNYLMVWISFPSS